jgi:hypothetical protein
MYRLGIEPWPRWEASSLEKSHSNIMLIAIWNIYIRAGDQWRILATKVLWALRTVCNMYGSVTYIMNAGLTQW